MRLLITGGCGFLGSNLSRAFLERGDEVYVIDDLSRHGAAANLAWLRERGALTFLHGDVRLRDDVVAAIRAARPQAVLHLAGQVAMTTSIDRPRRDFEINAGGAINVLEAVRRDAPEAAVLFSSTNKVYGDLDQYHYTDTGSRYTCDEYPLGFDEVVPLDFRSPYGCSKGAADQYMLDYHRTFGLRTVVFRHSSMYGGRQFATEDQGWIGWFCDCARALRDGEMTGPLTISGDGKQVRDLLHADDMVRLYAAAIDRIEAVQGQAFNVGGGIDNSLSLLELFRQLEPYVGRPITYTSLEWRHSDQRVFVADTRKALRLLDWKPVVDRSAGLDAMLRWVEASAGTGE